MKFPQCSSNKEKKNCVFKRACLFLSQKRRGIARQSAKCRRRTAERTPKLKKTGNNGLTKGKRAICDIVFMSHALVCLVFCAN